MVTEDGGLGISQSVEGEILSLTSVRGVAAFWVVVFHFSEVMFGFLPEANILGPLIASGGFAVPLFFILSGYVLGLRYLIKLSSPTIKSVLRFWWLRLGRVYPVHLCTLLVSVIIFTRRGWPTDEGHSVGRLIANLSLTQAWDYSYRLSWNYPSWSISSEWFAYLIFPPLAVALSRVGRASALALLIAACVLSACVYSIRQQLAFEGLAVVLPTFVGGVVLAILIPSGRSSWRTHPWAEVELLAILSLPFIVGSGQAQSSLYLLLFFALVGSLGVQGNQCMAFWKVTPLFYLGEISYSLYMTHAITITLMSRFFPFGMVQRLPLTVRFAVFLGCLVVILGVALAVYFAVERPLRSLSRRLGTSQKAEPSTSLSGSVRPSGTSGL
jgi:peptidoglycan/LPS O-acetylase OafA/YrhL